MPSPCGPPSPTHTRRVTRAYGQSPSSSPTHRLPFSFSLFTCPTLSRRPLHVLSRIATLHRIRRAPAHHGFKNNLSTTCTDPFSPFSSSSVFAADPIYLYHARTRHDVYTGTFWRSSPRIRLSIRTRLGFLVPVVRHVRRTTHQVVDAVVFLYLLQGLVM